MVDILKKIKIRAILPAAALLAAAAIGTTYAWQTWDLDIKNELKSHETIVEVVENFDKENPFDHKEVAFRNNGSSSVFLRYSYTEYWEKDGYILSNRLSDGTEIAVKAWVNSDQWEKIDDGWFYYNKILKQGDSTDKILEKVTLPTDFDTAHPEYIGASYHLYFKVEAVQCSDGNNTLNSEAVNADATEKLFGRKAVVDKKGNVTWD